MMPSEPPSRTPNLSPSGSRESLLLKNILPEPESLEDGSIRLNGLRGFAYKLFSPRNLNEYFSRNNNQVPAPVNPQPFQLARLASDDAPYGYTKKGIPRHRPGPKPHKSEQMLRDAAAQPVSDKTIPRLGTINKGGRNDPNSTKYRSSTIPGFSDIRTSEDTDAEYFRKDEAEQKKMKSSKLQSIRRRNQPGRKLVEALRKRNAR